MNSSKIPKIKIIIKVIRIILKFIKIILFKEEIIGKIIIISTSKIKNISRIKKNRIENGWGQESLGSNPHSKEDIFSRDKKFFLDKMEVSLNSSPASIIIIMPINIKIKFS